MFHPNAVAAVSNAPKDEVRRRSVLTLVAAMAALIGGYLFALLAVHGLWVKGAPPQLAAGFNAFALLFVMALAIERLIQPLVPILGPDTTIAKAALQKVQAADAPEAVPAAEASVSDSRSKTALVTWGVATGLASIMAASLNITLLRTLTMPTGTHPPFWLDLLVTGLVVGAGTKPLNDLWTRLQNK
jgi:hypothetical protein